MKDGAKTEVNVLIHTIPDLILELKTSNRALNALTEYLEDGAEKVGLFYVPFVSGFETEMEYRVLCCPGSSGKILGVSLYRWHEPWKHAGIPEEDRCRLVEWNIHGACAHTMSASSRKALHLRHALRSETRLSRVQF